MLSGRRSNLTGYHRNRTRVPLTHLCPVCEMWCVPLTASWSTSRSKKKYPYYRCRENCQAVKARPDKLHAMFLDWLERMAPEPDSMAGIKGVIRTVWKQRQGDAPSSCAPC